MKAMRPEYFQIVVLFGSIVLLGYVIARVGGREVYPYVGLTVAAAGISISFQQLYIFSRVAQVVEVGRREFYRSTSFGLLIFGVSLLFRNIVLLFNNGKIAPPSILLAALDELSLLFFYLAMPFMASLLISFLHPYRAIPEAGIALEERKGRLGGWLIHGDTHLLNQTKDLRSGEKYFLKAVWYLQVFLVYLALLLAAADFWQLVSITEITGWERTLPGGGWILLGATPAVMVGGYLVLRRFHDLILGEAEVMGFGMFIVFLSLFVIPPVVQWLSSPAWGGYGRVFRGGLIVAGFAVIILAAVWRRRLRDPEFRKDKKPADSAEMMAERIFYLYLLFGMAGLFLLDCGVQFVWTAEWAAYPISSVSFIFFAFACAWMTAVDLAEASRNYKLVKEEYASDLFVSRVAHELFNPIRPVHTFVTDEDLLRLLHEPREDADLERARKALLEFHPYVTGGVNRIISFASELRQRSNMGSRDEVIDLVELTNRFVEDFAKSLPFLSELSVVVHPPTRSIGCPERFAVLGNQDVWLSVLRILLDNALEATAEGRDNHIHVVMELDLQGRFVVRIRDTGRGMTEMQKQRYGEPHSSSKAGGWGMGVHTAREWLKTKMNGELSLPESAPQQGTEVKIMINRGKEVG